LLFVSGKWLYICMHLPILIFLIPDTDVPVTVLSVIVQISHISCSVVPIYYYVPVTVLEI